ncbi:unnamed protein product, partial [Prorocentrum cordatum]
VAVWLCQVLFLLAQAWWLKPGSFGRAGDRHNGVGHGLTALVGSCPPISGEARAASGVRPAPKGDDRHDGSPALHFLAALPPAERTTLLSRGIRSQLDLAGLAPTAVHKMLGTPSDAFRLAWDQAKGHLASATSGGEPSIPIHKLFPKRTVEVEAKLRWQLEPGGRQRRPGGTGEWRKPKVNVTQDALDLQRRQRAAARLMVILRGNLDHSTFRAEASESGTDRWLAHYERVMATSFEAAGMCHAARTWERWVKWGRNHECLGAIVFAGPTALEVALWLSDVAGGGPTAVRGVLVALRWLQANLGFNGLPLDSPLLRGTTEQHPERVLRQAVELPFKVWVQYVHLASKGKGAIQLMARLILYVATISLRFKHAQRHSFQHQLCSSRTLVGRVSKGKVLRGAAFYVAGPTYAAPGWRAFGEMYAVLNKRIPDATYLIPDLVLPTGCAVDELADFIERPMGYAEFTGCLRSLAMRPPLQLARSEVRSITTYSLRRKLASIADRIQLPLERRAELGDWRDRVADGQGGWKATREPMCVRYSAARLETSAMSRRVCLHALHEAHCAGATDDEQLRHQANHDELYRQALGIHWGEGAQRAVFGDAEHPQPREDLHVVEEPEQAGGSGSSSNSDDTSAGSSSSCAELLDPVEVRWLLPGNKNSKLHLARDDGFDESACVPACRQSPFKWGCEVGVGLDVAGRTGRSWSPRCLRRLRRLVGPAAVQQHCCSE